MKKILSIITLILTFCGNVHAQDNEIVAIVEDTVITSSELNEMSKLMAFFTNQESKNPADKANFRSMVLNLMINDAAMLDYADKNHIKPSANEINGFISGLEESHKLKKGDLAKKVKEEHGVSDKIFKHKMRVETVRSKIIREVLAQKLDIGNKDAEALALNTNHKDANLQLQVLTAINDRDLTYRRLEGLRRKIKNCDSLKRIGYQHIATLENLNTKLSDLPVNMQTMAKNLPIGQPSDVIVDGAFKVLIVCDRSLNEYTPEDNYNMLNFIGNKKVMKDSQKFFEDLRKKAYVKIIQPNE